MDRSHYPTATELQLKGVVRTSLDHPDPTPAQIERRERSIQKLKSMGLPFSEKLPVVEDAAELQLRSPPEVARRCIAIAICGIKGESDGDEELVAPLVKKYGAQASFTPKETAFIRNRRPPKQELVDYSWQYECAHVLLWALGEVEALTPPHKPCDAASEITALMAKDPEAFIKNATLRKSEEILDMVDLYYHLDWAAVEMRVKGRSCDRIDEGVVRERHRALNWLIRYMNQDWDDVTTDT